MSGAGPAARPLMIWLVKRRYMARDLLDDRYGRYFEIPRRLAATGRVVVLCLDYAGRAHRRESPAPGLSIESFPLSRLGALLARARRLAREHPSPVVVGGSDSPFALMARHVARAAGGRFLCDVYDDYDTFASGRIPLMRRLFHRAARRADRVVVFEPLLEARLRGRGVTRTVTVPNGIDAAMFAPRDRHACRAELGLAQEARIVGYLGAILPDRTMEDIFGALEILRREDGRVLLLLAGPMAPGTVLPEGARYDGIVEHARIPVLIGACDVLTATVRKDASAGISFPVKVMEYVAGERPFLTPDCGGAGRYLASFPEYLYPVGDAAALAHKLRPWLHGARPRLPAITTWDDAARAFAEAAGWPEPEARACPGSA